MYRIKYWTHFATVNGGTNSGYGAQWNTISKGIKWFASKDTATGTFQLKKNKREYCLSTT